MHQVQDRVRLVDATEIGAREVRVTVPRGEIQEVLMSKDGEPELVIDVTRGDEPAQTLRLAWDPAELEDLLRQTDGDNVGFAFDGSELERLLEDDVAAHGLREAAAVLAVAATTVAGGAGIAQASTLPAAQSGSASSAVVSEQEWPQAVPQSTAAAPTSEQEWPQLVTGDAAAPAATHQAVVSEQEWPQAVPKSTAAAPTSEQEWPQLVTGDATQAPAPAATPVAASTSDGTDVGTAAAVTGGAALLLISAAAFTVRRQRGVEPRPA
jgi:hypothetical protein